MSLSITPLLRGLVCLVAAIPAVTFAQLFPVPQVEKGSDPTMTFLYSAKEPKATLVYIVGGDGSVGVKQDWNEQSGYFARYHFNLMLQKLSDPKATSGNVNVVIFDNPTKMPVGANSWSGLRAGSDHLTRIESVVHFYKEKFNKPVWLMGHSMGTISIVEFYKHLLKKKQESSVAGLIYSAGVNNNSFEYETTKLPVLLIHHVTDGCNGTELSNAQRLGDKLKEAGNKAAEFVPIKTGEPQSGNPCYTGYHMYFGASDEVAKVIDQFMAKHLVPQ